MPVVVEREIPLIVIPMRKTAVATHPLDTYSGIFAPQSLSSRCLESSLLTPSLVVVTVVDISMDWTKYAHAYLIRSKVKEILYKY